MTSAVFPELDAVVGPRAGAGTYTLTLAGGHWILLTRHDDGARPAWSTPLAGHGAGPHASRRVAQAVAVRVLHELGVEVEGWLPEPSRPDGEAPDVVAVTAPATTARGS